MARPYEKLPPGAKAHLEAMAANGLLSESAAARALGMPYTQFRRVIRDHKPSRDIWDDALSIERDQLLTALYHKACEGDTKAAQTLLAVRHGMSEKAPQGAEKGVHVTFNLPTAMDAEQYMKALEVKQEALPNDSGN